MLAVALGVGTAVASGSAIASADASGDTSPSATSRSVGSASPRGPQKRPVAASSTAAASATARTLPASVRSASARAQSVPARTVPRAVAAQTSAPSFEDIVRYTFFNETPAVNPVQNPGQSATGVVTGDLRATTPNNAVLTYSLTIAPTRGAVDLHADGTYTYTPTATLAQAGGTDTFTVTVDNGSAYRLTGLAGAIQAILHSLAQAAGISRSDTVVTAVPVTIGATTPTSYYDGFDGPAGAPPDPTKWSTIQGTGWDIGVEDYQAANAVLDGQGHLAIQAIKTDTGYTSGRVQTSDLASFGYGTLTARIKMPSGQGLWPAFWMVGADESTNPWPGAGEINIVEMVNNAQTHYSAIHGPITGVWDYLQSQITGTGPDLSTDFHNYWLTRAENSITVGVDNTVWGTFTPDMLPANAQWVVNKPFYAILNLAVGGPWAGPPDSSTQFPATMLVDWVQWNPAS
ncbi:hypothetical protein MANY_16050 [Mycolicibacterium anyangense]|uniref:GH16 domain-containing protein n=2 Tax=Mycolicibacterium anyangense TaxID=1431246 RepID=A0A6N4W6W1_9MYCO|nr:hypothetical protein MANY_16050 [Mycolicibacterium anyangense]